MACMSSLRTCAGQLRWSTIGQNWREGLRCLKLLSWTVTSNLQGLLEPYAGICRTGLCIQKGRHCVSRVFVEQPARLQAQLMGKIDRRNDSQRWRCSPVMLIKEHDFQRQF